MFLLVFLFFFAHDTVALGRIEAFGGGKHNWFVFLFCKYSQTLKCTISISEGTEKPKEEGDKPKEEVKEEPAFQMLFNPARTMRAQVSY